MKKLSLILVLISCTNLFSQASWGGKLYFNLTHKGKIISKKDFIEGNIKIYSIDIEHNKYIEYDTIVKSFVYYSHSIAEFRSFYLIIKDYTLKIEFPALQEKCLYIKSPIEIDNKVYNFNSSQIIDFIINNKSNIITKKLDELFYFDSPEITELNVNKANCLKEVIFRINEE